VCEKPAPLNQSRCEEVNGVSGAELDVRIGTPMANSHILLLPRKRCTPQLFDSNGCGLLASNVLDASRRLDDFSFVQQGAV
jgi:hypothetical protein